MSGDILFIRRKSMSIDITIEEMEALPAESYELFDIRGEIERAHGILMHRLEDIGHEIRRYAVHDVSLSNGQAAHESSGSRGAVFPVCGADRV